MFRQSCGMTCHLRTDGIEIDEPGFEQRPCHRLQCRVHPPVQIDLVVECRQDVRDSALFIETGEGGEPRCRSISVC